MKYELKLDLKLIEFAIKSYIILQKQFKVIYGPSKWISEF